MTSSTLATVKSGILMTPQVFLGIAARMLFGWSTSAYKGEDILPNTDPNDLPTFFSNATLMQSLKEIVFTPDMHLKLSDESLVKIVRQLEFWYTDGELQNDLDALVEYAQSLVRQSTWYLEDVMNSNKPNISLSSLLKSAPKVPHVRFGKTELQMPIVTCGGMRLQNSWCPDNLPVAPSKRDIVSSPPQENLKSCIRSCLALGINHFETARMYGTSEFQFVEALYELIQEGEISRSDFIFQTKLVVKPTKAEFETLWKASWANIQEKLGYVDLFAMHAISFVNEELEACLDFCEELKKEGHIRHIGFSTHATSEQIMNLINTERFEYINVHEHYIGSYHGTGTPDTCGGQGNLACVKRALELDMGVFQISPFDKGGMLYRPSETLAKTVGRDISPMAFAALYGWKKIGFHTTSVGIARPSDLDEVMDAVRLYSAGDKGDTILKATEERLNRQMEKMLGKEWMEKGLLNLPSCYDESTNGVAIGHILWCHNLITSFGMYEFAKARYNNMESFVKWDDKKTFDENVAKMGTGNAGRHFIESVDLTEALKNHSNPSLVLNKLKETHKWLTLDVKYTDEELAKQGWKKGYNLTVWTEMPGDIDPTKMFGFFLGLFTGGRFGKPVGPGASFRREASQLRRALE